MVLLLQCTMLVKMKLWKCGYMVQRMGWMSVCVCVVESLKGLVESLKGLVVLLGIGIMSSPVLSNARALVDRIRVVTPPSGHLDSIVLQSKEDHQCSNGHTGVEGCRHDIVVL